MFSPRCLSHGCRSRPAWGAWIEIPTCTRRFRCGSGRAPHGARGLKYMKENAIKAAMGRAPHGARGLKFTLIRLFSTLQMSRPVWGAWIEMLSGPGFLPKIPGRAPYGARGLKYQYELGPRGTDVRRAPYGARGLKSQDRQAKGGPPGRRAPYGARGLKC